MNRIGAVFAQSTAVRAAIGSGVVRLAVLPVSAACGVIATKVVIETWGLEAYANYGLIISIVAMLPFVDLGLSAGLMNAVATSTTPDSDSELSRYLTTVMRLLVLSSIGLGCLAVLVSVTSAWPRLLGSGLLHDGGPASALWATLILAASIPLGIGARILTGLGRNQLQVGLSGIQGPLTLILVIVFAKSDFPAWTVPLTVYLAAWSAALASAVAAYRAIPTTVMKALRNVPDRHVRAATVLDTALPMLVQMIALPVALQSARVILSHVSSVPELAEYNLASQLFTPVWQVTSVAALALWPVYSRARSAGESGLPIRMMFGFAAVGGGLAMGVALLAPRVDSTLSDGQVELGVGICGAFVLFMLAQSAKAPLGMYTTDARGLRAQAWIVVAMVAMSVATSIPLARTMGATGVVLSGAASVTACQIVGALIVSRRIYSLTN